MHLAYIYSEVLATSSCSPVCNNEKLGVIWWRGCVQSVWPLTNIMNKFRKHIVIIYEYNYKAIIAFHSHIIDSSSQFFQHLKSWKYPGDKASHTIFKLQLIKRSILFSWWIMAIGILLSVLILSTTNSALSDTDTCGNELFYTSRTTEEDYILQTLLLDGFRANKVNTYSVQKGGFTSDCGKRQCIAVHYNIECGDNTTAVCNIIAE